jgi:1-acyl-sn-glycerol-3-phosphate acyltransferase
MTRKNLFDPPPFDQYQFQNQDQHKTNDQASGGGIFLPQKLSQTLEDILIPFEEGFLKKLLPVVHFLRLYHRYEVKNLAKIPFSGPCLLAVNHSFATYDGFLLGATIYLKTGRAPCGLADHNFFKTKWSQEISKKFRLVEGLPENAQRLVQQEELIMVAPGGMREALRPTTTEKHQIKWQKRLGFVRLAVKNQCPVVLAACPSADEIYEVYPNILTKLIYQNFKLPFAVIKGLGPSFLPKPVKLVHHLKGPFKPPKIEPDEDADSMLIKIQHFHELLVFEMEQLLKKASSKR